MAGGAGSLCGNKTSAMKLITGLLACLALTGALPIDGESKRGPTAAAPLVLQEADKIHPRCLCSSSSSSSSSSCSSSSDSCITEYQCSPCDAVQTVINKDSDFLALLGKHNWNAASVLVQCGATFDLVDEHNGICLRQAGTINNMWLLYQKTSIFDIIQSVSYCERDGSVEVRAVEVAEYKGQSVNVRDVTRKYTSKQGCDYKLAHLSATSFLCRTN